MSSKVPPGWPAAVPPPSTQDWEQAATGWLFDLVPPDYRRYEVLRRHPALLARFAADHVDAGLAAATTGWRSLRADLRGQFATEVVDAAMTAYEREGQRLSESARAVAVVRAALEGKRWVPRL